MHAQHDLAGSGLRQREIRYRERLSQTLKYGSFHTREPLKRRAGGLDKSKRIVLQLHQVAS